jgi:manganese/zinc/iron transport system permease protein
MTLAEFFQLDLVPMLAALLSCVTCGLLGTLLLLTRNSMMGDAISHAVLPGIAAGFWLTGTRAALPMVAGAIAAAVLAVALIGLIRRLARLEAGAAMGVVFSGLFALGLLMLVWSGAERVDLDLDCVLFGILETLVWPEATGFGSLLDAEALAALPPELMLLAAIFAVTLLVLALLWKELRLAAFDPGFGRVIGFDPRPVRALLMLLIAAACVASFWAVGSILVIAALIGPAAIARLLTDRYAMTFVLAAAAGAGIALAGYGAAALLPAALGAAQGFNAAGMIAVMAGLGFALAAAVSPFRASAFRRRRAAASRG